MKIAIIANGFTGATLPLAQHLKSIGHSIDCYYLTKIGSKSIESLDFDSPIKFANKPVQISKKNSLYRYLDTQVSVNTLSVFKRKKRLEKFYVGKIIRLINYWTIKRFAKWLTRQGYDYIDLVIHSDLELIIGEELKKQQIPFCISFHEVLQDHSQKISRLKDVVTESIKWKTKIVVHSVKTKCDLISQSNNDNIEKYIHVIKFGKFESYLSFGGGKDMKLEPNSLLYLGYIHSYKGLGVLYEAISELKRHINIKVIVAGSGFDPILDQMKQDSSFIVINRFIDNDELVYLVQNCKALVCPYLSASQSGLVQTGMVFGKPIIATRVGAFSEIIQDGINGYLANPSDVGSLRDAIVRCLTTSNKTVAINNQSIDWDYIASQYVELIFKNR